MSKYFVASGKILSISPEDDDHRMMASTIVFVIEPGVTALGMGNTR